MDLFKNVSPPIFCTDCSVLGTCIELTDWTAHLIQFSSLFDCEPIRLSLNIIQMSSSRFFSLSLSVFVAVFFFLKFWVGY